MNFYIFEYTNGFQKSQLCNSFLGLVSNNFTSRLIPIRNGSSKLCNYNPWITSPLELIGYAHISIIFHQDAAPYVMNIHANVVKYAIQFNANVEKDVIVFLAF